MAEQNQAPKADEQKPKAKLPFKTLLIILGVLLLEGGTITVFMVFKGGPSEARGSDEPILETAEPVEQKMAEVVLADEFSIDNYVAGRTRIVIRCSVTAKVAQDKQAELQEKVTAHATEIRDAIRTLISSAQPENLRDPKLQVIKREIKSGMENILGEGLIEEILLPEWQSYTQD